ncbi:MAG: carboxypeptidase regulatory-like domain-containing protein [Polyangiaceae bacterium]
MNARRILVAILLSGAVLPAAVGAAITLRGRTPPSTRSLQSSPSDAIGNPPRMPVTDDRAPTIRGHILDADGRPVDGASVRLVSTSTPYRVYQATATDPSGAFSFRGVGPWRWRVVADHGDDGVVTSAALRVGERQTLELTLVLSAFGAIRGAVFDAQGRPVAGVELSIDGLPWTIRTTSDVAGAFRLTTVPEQAIALVAAARGYRSERVSLGSRDDQAEFVVRIVLGTANPVDGEVEDDEGNPVKARVVACEGERSEAATQSADDGSFELPPGAIGCDAVAEHADFAPSDIARVVEGRRLLLRLKAGGGIAGAVVDERGAGLSPVRIGIESFSPARGKDFDRRGVQNFADPAGVFRWDKLAPGSYVLTASASGRPPARSGSIEVRAGVLTSGVRVVIAKGGLVFGTVTDEGNVPLADVDLHFDQVSRVLDSDSVAHTNGAGEFRLEGAPAGPLTVRAHKNGFRVKLVSGLRVDSGSAVRQDLTLVALDGGPSMELGGIGAGLAQTPAGIELRNVFPGDPGARSGLHAGDRIVGIDGEPTDGMSVADALQRIRGQPGTSVGVSVLRPDTGDLLDLTIVRGRVVH